MTKTTTLEAITLDSYQTALACFLINHFSDGQHPVADEKTLKFFTPLALQDAIKRSSGVLTAAAIDAVNVVREKLLALRGTQVAMCCHGKCNDLTSGRMIAHDKVQCDICDFVDDYYEGAEVDDVSLSNTDRAMILAALRFYNSENNLSHGEISIIESLLERMQ